MCLSSFEKGVSSQILTTFLANFNGTNLAPIDKTLASLCSRESFNTSKARKIQEIFDWYYNMVHKIQLLLHLEICLPPLLRLAPNRLKL